MTAFRYRLKSLVWLALVAVCGVALGPTISRVLDPAAFTASARVHEQHEQYEQHEQHEHHAMEMGSEAGMSMGMAEPDSSEHSHGPDHSSCVLDCCALCAVAATPWAVVAIFFAIESPEKAVVPPPEGRSDASPQQQDLWSSAAPRGPPLRS